MRCVTDSPAAEGNDPFGGDTTTSGRLLRLVTYNAFQSPKLDYTCRLLKAMAADVYCLQELVVNDFHHAPRDQSDIIGAHLGMHHFSAYTCRGLVRNAGSAILSKHPFGPAEVLAGTHGHRFGLATIVEHPQRPFALINSHFTWVPRPVWIGAWVSIPFRTAEMRTAIQWIRKSGLPGIIAGDFNALPYTPEYWTMARAMIDCTRAVPMEHRATRPTWKLPTQLDYIFVTPGVRTLSCRVLPCSVSDHRPVLVELDISTEAARRQLGQNRSLFDKVSRFRCTFSRRNIAGTHESAEKARI